MDEERESIEGKVAGILSEEELVVNVGARNGVKKGMVFNVLAATPLEFHDPDTGELLTVLDRTKVTVRVTKVEDKASICATYRTHFVGGGILSGIAAISGLYDAPRQVKETLKAESAALPPPLEESESYVKVGDRVREVIETQK